MAANLSALSGLAILCYHQVEDVDDPVLRNMGVTAPQLAGQIDGLLGAGHTFVSLEQVFRALETGERLPRRSVLLTFDDAYESFRLNGLPILRERGLPAVLFVVSGEVGGTNSWDSSRGHVELPLMDEAGIAEAAQAGLTIGSHSATHAWLIELGAQQLEDELVRSRDEIARLGHGRPRAFCYPGGDQDERVRRATAAAGYELAFAGTMGVVRADTDPMALPRIGVGIEDTPERLVRRVGNASWPPFVRNLAKRAARALRLA